METQILEDYPDRIAETFLDKTILITGGTGFVGKVFMEKLLRTCPDVKKIYVLVRTKKHKEPKERMEEVFRGPNTSKMETANLEDYPDRIAETFLDKTILITGGTGFVGKVFIEKLLRTCPDVKKIYVLVRTRKNKEPKERMEEAFRRPLFDMLKKQRGEDVLEKVEAISADMEAIDLDLSLEDRKKLVDEVEMIYHSAATIRFDEGLKKAVFMNVRGTKLMLKLAKECKKLNIFAYISTAYSQPKEKVLYEKAYPPPFNPYRLIKICEWLDGNILDNVTNKILDGVPNTYTFTKALAEAIVSDEMDNFPAIIIRPSIIVPIWKEPIPGWIDNINGPVGLIIGTGKGVIRTMYAKSEICADFIPIDTVVNYILAATFIYFQTKKRFFNVACSEEFKINFEKLINLCLDTIRNELPFNGTLWYPGAVINRWWWCHNVEFALFQLIPAFVLDKLLILLGRKPFLMRVQRRIWKSYELFEFYGINQWSFNNDELLVEREKLNPKERATYKLDFEDANLQNYFLDLIHGIRLYILSETDDTIPFAKKFTAILWFVDRIFKILFLLGFLYLLYKHVFTSYLLQTF